MDDETPDVATNGPAYWPPAESQDDICRAAVVDADGLVDNVIIVVRGDDSWQPPEGLEVAELPDDSPVAPGWTYTDGDGTPPPDPEA